MKKLLPFFAFFLIACTPNSNTPSKPNEPSYIGLPIVSYTVSSTDQVLTSGDVPSGTLATFSSSYNRRHQLIAGTSATFTLSGMDGIKIRSITLHMRSNTSSGAGSLRVTNNQSLVWSIDNAPFNSSSWHGAYTTDTASIFHLFPDLLECGGELKIIITATVNSLYIFRYDIEYEPDPNRQPKQDSTLVSGLKTISVLRNIYRLTGPLTNGVIAVKEETEPLANEDLYWVRFVGDSQATLQHYETQSYIGFSGRSLNNTATPWFVDYASDTCITFYTTIKDKYYMLATDPNQDFAVHLISDTRLRLQFWTLFSINH